MTETLEYIKHLEFDKGKFHIVFADPNYVNFEELSKTVEGMPPGPETMFIPAFLPNDSLRLVSFESIEALERFVQELKENKNA